MSELALVRILKLGARGKDVRAMKRGLARAGHGTLAMSANPLMGPFAVRHLKSFQFRQALEMDGEYGKATHAKLIQWFDKYARQLYEQAGDEVWNPVAADAGPAAKGSVQLPRDFVPTHQTAGLEGYPALDVFAQPNTTVLAPADGIVDRLSGRDPKLGGSAGGPYGWSIYLTTGAGRFYMTHFATRNVTVGQRVAQGEPIGTVCDSAVSGKPNTSHIHHAKKRT
jgi:murein DD-endopeptidase MepM/ murein hydrolase activator NlpD